MAERVDSTNLHNATLLGAVLCPKCRRQMRSVQIDGKPGFFCTFCQEPHEDLPKATQKPVSATDTSDYLPSLFLEHWPSDAPQPEREYQFAPGRGCRFDLAFVSEKLAVECEGNQHRTKERFFSDIEKYNTATILGWRVLRASSKILREQPRAFADMVRQTLLRQ